jgi:hypothetical protein
MNLAKTFLKNLTFFNRTGLIGVTYKGVASVHMAQLGSTVSNSRSRRCDYRVEVFGFFSYFGHFLINIQKMNPGKTFFQKSGHFQSRQSS